MIMSKTMALGAPVGRAVEPAATKGVFSRMLEAFASNKQAHADRMVRPYLAQASVSDLAALGFTASEIAEIKRDRHMPVVNWF